MHQATVVSSDSNNTNIVFSSSRVISLQDAAKNRTQTKTGISRKWFSILLWNFLQLLATVVCTDLMDFI